MWLLIRVVLSFVRGVSVEISASECWWGGDDGGGTGSSASSEARNVSTNRVGRKWAQMHKK